MFLSYKAEKQENSSLVNEKRNNDVNNTTFTDKNIIFEKQSSEIPYWQKEWRRNRKEAQVSWSQSKVSVMDKWRIRRETLFRDVEVTI